MTFKEHVCQYDPDLFKDDRGYLKVISEDKSLGMSYKESYSKKGVFRGMHIQTPPYSQVKHIMIMEGKIIDYLIVLDRKSEHFGEIFSQEIDHSNKIYKIPNYCAHGYYALQESVIRYMCIGQYSEENEISINECHHGLDNLIISKKDREGISLKKAKELFREVSW
tara:strand:+ start:158 stop:655 length:498 start_codon:yes stop_codon:yes gene_type:complete